MSEGKLDFAGKAWVDKATEVLEALVNEHGDEDASFSVCEVFTDAPTTYPQVVPQPGTSTLQGKVFE